MVGGSIEVQIELAGAVRLVVGGRVSDDPALRGVVPRRVLAVLALEQRAVSRDELGDAVWGDQLPRTWETALRGAVHQLRRAATAAAPDAPTLIRTAFGCYQLDPAVRVDLVDALASADQADQLLDEGDADGARLAARAAVDVLARPVLLGVDGEWLDQTRRRLEPVLLRARVALSAASTACGDHGGAIESADQAVTLDPYDERAHRQLMAAHAAAGDRAAALLAYRRCRELLADDLGVAPSDQTESMRAALAAPPHPIAPVTLPSTLDTSLALVGRTDEVDTLTRAWRSVADGASGTAVVVVGAAGNGKSRLAAEVAAAAHRDGAAVAHGRFDPDDLGALSAFSEVLGQLGVAWPGAAHAGVDRTDLFATARAALSRIAGADGLVVVLDDAHWADRPSLALLADLAEHPVPGLLVLVTARDDWLPPTLAELLEHIDVLTLAPLSAEGTGELVAAWAGHRPAGDAASAIHLRSGGNPYFITALLQDLADRGAVDMTSGMHGLSGIELSATVPEVVAAAIERCGRNGADLALRAAVLGDEFRSDVLVDVAGQPRGVVEATLERLAHARLVGRSAEGSGKFHFVHGLVRQAILDAADVDATRAAHRAAAVALQERTPGTPEVLTHLLGARDDAQLGDAVELAIAIASELVDTGAPDEAVTILEAVLRWLDAGAATDRRRAGLLMGLANAEIARDRLAVGRQALRDAAELAVAAGDPSLLGSGVLLLRPPTVAEHDADTVEVAKRLLALAPPASALEVTAGCWLAAEIFSVDPERAAQLAHAARTTAEALGDPVLHRFAAVTWHLLARAFTDPAERRHVLDQVLALPRRAASRATEITSQVFIAGDCLELGDSAAATGAVAAALHATSGHGNTHLRWIAMRNEVMLEVLNGNLDRADALLARASQVASVLPIPEAVTLPVLQQLLTRYHQHRLNELQPLVSDFAAVVTTGYVPIVAGWVDAELRMPTARASVDRAVDVALDLPREAAWTGVTALAVEAAAAVRHPATAELASRLAHLSGQHAVIVTIAYLGAIDRYLALAAAATGDAERAASLFDRAQAQHRAVGARCYLERTAAEREVQPL